MAHDWKEFTEISGGRPVEIERAKIKGRGISIEGSFELPPLAQLTMEDQIFIVAFVKCRGSIKDMEKLFGISYPTVKSRLNSIADRLEFVEIDPPAPGIDVLSQIDTGDISVEEAIKKLKGGKR